jgi:intracellular multiplication protein IcmC
MKNAITNMLMQSVRNPNCVTEQRYTLASACRFSFFVTAISFLIVVPAYAQTLNTSGLTAQTMLQNLGLEVPSFMRLVTAIAYVLGMVFVIQGVMKLKHLGESRTMMSREHSPVGPILLIGVGAALLYLPTTVWVGMNTFWTSASPYSYNENTDVWSQYLNICFQIVQLIGVIAFIRGLIILSRLGEHGGQPGTFSRGLTHIIGGIFCINIYQFIQVINLTLGIQFGS